MISEYAFRYFPPQPKPMVYELTIMISDHYLDHLDRHLFISPYLRVLFPTSHTKVNSFRIAKDPEFR